MHGTQCGMLFLAAMAGLASASVPGLKARGHAHKAVYNGLKAADAAGDIQWTDVPGGRVTTWIPNKSSQRTKRQTLEASDPGGLMAWINGGFNKAPEVDNYAAEEFCGYSGSTVKGSVFTAGADLACKALLSSSATGVVAQNGWKVFVQSDIVNSIGEASELLYAIGVIDSTTSINLDPDLCKAAISLMMNSGETQTCANPAAGGLSYGGVLKLAESFLINLDVNSFTNNT